MTDNHTEQQQERAAHMVVDQGLPPSGQLFERKKQYRARGCRGGAYRKGRTQRSASYNMRRDQERRGRVDDASAHQEENDPRHLNRHRTSYYNRHHNYYHRHHHHHQNYHDRPHPSNFIKKKSSDHSHNSKFRTLSILPDGEDIHLEDDEPTYPSDNLVGNDAGADKADSSPNVLTPILPSKSSDITAAAPIAESTAVPQTAVIAPISKKVVQETVGAGITKQAACSFSFFALSPSSFLTGKKTKNVHSYF
ncbi:hypothetical protein ACHAXM_009728 [Skeletonema potamos]|jgi:hypothetical protein